MERVSAARLLGIGLVAGALAAGCASPAPSASPSSVSSPAASASASPAAAPSSAPPVAVSPKASKPVKGGGTAMVLTGIVTYTDVEGGCWGLRADGTDGFKTYELLGGDRAVLTPGARVRVTG